MNEKRRRNYRKDEGDEKKSLCKRKMMDNERKK